MPTVPGRKIFYVRSILFSALVAIVVFHLLSSLPGLYRSFEDYRQARRVSFLNDVSDDLFTAVGNFGFERGRVNVVLNDAGPVENMEKNRRFILARRKDGDKALADALHRLTLIQEESIAARVERIKTLGETVARLRRQAGDDLVVPIHRRDAGLPETWFSAMTGYIESIEALLVIVSRDISDADGMISRYSALKHETLALRNTAGPEMSILSATILSGKPIQPKLAKKIETLQVITNHHFHILSFMCQGLLNSSIPEALKKLKKVYFEGYRPYRDAIFPLSLSGGPYPYTQEAFLAPGVRALKEIAAFMEVIGAETKAYARANQESARDRILFHLVASSGSLLVVILIVLYVNFKVVKPMGRLTSAVRRLAGGEMAIAVPHLEKRNEIGEMARALEVFKGMATQLEEDMQLIKTAEEKVRKSEDRLRRILDSLPDMIIEVDSKLKVLWANKAALDLNPDAVGMACYAAFPGKEQMCEGCYCAKALETGRIEGGIMYQPESKTAGESYWENIGIPLPGVDDASQTILEVSRNVTDRVKSEVERERLILELQEALAHVKTLSGLLPICMHCKKIRDDQGYWKRIEEYIQQHSDAKFSHSICRDCAEKHYPDLNLFDD